MQERQEEIIFNKFQQKEPLLNSSMIQCPHRHLATNICINEKCAKIALCCSEHQCQFTKVSHQCDKIMATDQLLQRLENKRIKIKQNLKKKFEKIIQSYDQIIDQMSKDRLQFIEFTTMFGLTRQMIDFVQLVREDKTDTITGLQANKIWRQVVNPTMIQTPTKMDNFGSIRHKQSQLQLLLDSVAYQTANFEGKQKIMSKFCQSNKITPDSLKTIQNNQEIEMNISLSCSKNIKLILQFRHLQFIPIQIKFFTNLRQLYLRSNLIHRITNLEGFTQLKILSLYNNKIEQIQGLDNLNSLEKLNLDLNLIKKIKGLDKLQNLQNLNLSKNNIEVIENLQNLRQLQQLNLSSNHIFKLENIDGLIKLKQLVIHSNPLQGIKQQKDKLAQLKNKLALNIIDRRQVTFAKLFGF